MEFVHTDFFCPLYHTHVEKNCLTISYVKNWNGVIETDSPCSHLLS